MSGTVLTILEGLQAGSQMRLSHGQSRVGSGIDCAVVVADAVMQPDHFEVVVGDVTVVRVTRPVILHDGTSLTAGSEFTITASTSFSAGSTRFQLDVPPPVSAQVGAGPSHDKAHLRRRITILCAAVGSTVMLCGLGMLFAGMSSVRHADASTMAVPHVAARAMDRTSAVSLLRNRLTGAGLTGVTVAVQSDGSLMAGGSLLPSEQPEWDAVRKWFDGRFGNDMVVIERFAPVGSLPSLRLAAVWSGDDPYVVDERGARLHPGASLDDGWTIDHIDDRHVVMRRGTHIVSLGY